MLPIIASYTIKDLERLSGIKAHTIRIWEQRYNLLKPDRTTTNIRQYRDCELRMLLNISLLIKHGSKISHVSKLTEHEINTKVQQLTVSPESENAYFDAQIDKLVFSMLDMSSGDVDSTLDMCIQDYGFEKTMLSVIIPFLYRIGFMWITGETSIVQEHFLSNLLRERMILEISQYKKEENDSSQSYVLFLPEAEWHEIGLLFASYLLKKRGKQVVYLGQNMPLNEVIYFSNKYKPKYLLTFLSSRYSVGSVEDYIQEISSKVLHSRILIAGNVANESRTSIPDNIHFLNEVSDLIKIAETAA
jgi:DNA-binding transcriptional MerR regulator